MSDSDARNSDARDSDAGSDGLAATFRMARDAGTGITGLTWLVVLYALSLGSAFLILSATVFQSTTIQGSTDQAGDILKILRIIPERETLVIDQLQITRHRLVELTRQRSTQDGRRQRSTLRLESVIDDLAEILSRAETGPQETAVDLLQYDPSEREWKAAATRLRERLREGSGAPDDGSLPLIDSRSEIEQILDRVEAAEKERGEARRLHDEALLLLKLETQELDRLRRDRDTIRDEIFEEHKIEPEIQANISQVLNTNVSVLLYLVQLPSEFLTFALTVSMGLLGSTIHMSRELFRNGKERGTVITMTWFVARPLEGMAAAIIIYIFFRAGQLTLTGGSTADNKIDDLNPYVLSFLAIASGLLSEKAYNRIVVGARNVLATPEAAQQQQPAPPSETRSPVL